MMKKFLLSLMLASAAMTANAQYQYPNSSFDEDFISSYGSYKEPRGWHGYATIDASTTNNAGRSGNKLVQSTDVRPGASGKSVYVMSTSIFGVVANGVLTNGQIYTHSTTPTDGSKNYNWSDATNTRDASTFGENNQFFTPFTGRPDAVKVWVKFAPAKSGTGNARVSMILHKPGTVMYDPEDNVKDKSIVVARAAQAIPACDWTQITVPFTYVSSADPGLILATFSTNETPGKGDANDKLYVDDIEMVYLSEMLDPTYNGTALNFIGGVANVDAPYNAKLLKYTTGVGADVQVTQPTADNNFTLTIVINGNDVSVNPTNTHTYTIKFTGVAGGNDDESLASIKVPTLSHAEFEDGARYYMMNMATTGYLNNNNGFSATPQLYWNISASEGTVKSQYGNYLKLDRNGNGDKTFTSTTCPVTSTDTSIGTGMNYKFNFATEYFEMYRENMTYYKATIGISSKKGNVYAGANAQGGLQGYLGSTDSNTKWVLIAPLDYIVYYFCSNAASASLNNGVSYDITVLNNETKTTIDGLPLGVYSIDGGEKFYLSAGSTLDVTSANTTLTYYGRLNFALTAKFNGTTLTPNALCDEPYDKALLSLTANGNGVQNVEKFFDETTNELTVTVSGYGRQNEYVFKFAEPDLSLNATWYGEAVEDGAVITESYNAAKLVVTPDKGTTVHVDFVETTGVATITISSSTASETYKLQFPVYPAANGAPVIYQPIDALKNGVAVASLSNFAVTPLEGGNIDFAVQGVNGLGSLVAKNLSVAKNGSFCYNGQLRGTESEVLYPVTIYGNLNAEGQLVDACVDYAVGSTELWHCTYGLVNGSSRNYTYDIVVSINGDATTIEDNTIAVGNLENGNINFALKEFKMNLGGNDTYIGNIFLENLPIDKDGNFAFDGGILIGPGSDNTKDYGGLDLGIVPVKLRGQRYNGGEDLLVVIDIDMESLNQTIHVTLGADIQSTDKYEDDLAVTINGETSTVPNTIISIGQLKNGNITFTLQDFTMNIGGQQSPIGNVTIDNIALDERGGFTYDGIIRIGNGTDPNQQWGGPDLGDVPVVIRGSVFDYSGGNSTEGDKQCIVVIDIDMQESIDQRIHVTYGLETEGESYYEDDLCVTVNGETTTKEGVEIEIDKLRNDNIMLLLDNFTLPMNGHDTPVGSIALENLEVDENGRFSYEGVIRIGKGSDSSVRDNEWIGPELGDVPVIVNGLVNDNDCVFNIDIDMEATLGQTINVTFGAAPVSTNDYTDDLKVTVNGEATNTTATITMGELKAENFYSFSLNNFSLPVGNQTLHVGNIAINALELDANGKFTYNGKIRIAEGDLPGVETWAGPELGAIPMLMKGQKYECNDKEYLLVSISIDMQESIGQTIDVVFGATPIRNVALNDNLSVSVNGDENHQMADVNVGILRNGNINFTLRNFVLQMIGEGGALNEIPVGNLSIDALDIAANGEFIYTGTIRIGNGDDASVAEWSGPSLGDIPVVLNGKFSEADEKAYVTIDIDMMEQIGQVINVVFGSEFDATLSDLVQLIKKVNEGQEQKANIQPLVNKLLGK